MAIRGTEHYVFYTDQLLGAGSTGSVYFGRHKVGIECRDYFNCEYHLQNENAEADLQSIA